MSEIKWIADEAVQTILRRQIAEHGGIDGTRDEGLLTSALAHPKNVHVYDPEAATIFRLAASLAYGIARNHPFLDGNKRTALVVSRTFLLLNGVDIRASQKDKYITFLKLASGDLSEDELADWFEKVAV